MGARKSNETQSLDRAGVSIQGRRGRSAVDVQDPNGYTVELYRD